MQHRPTNRAPADLGHNRTPGGIGDPVRRVEDERLLRGNGLYVGDLALEGMAHACLVRSDRAHARVMGVDASGALALDGVLAVLTGDDVAADGLGGIPWEVLPPRPDGSPWEGVEPGAPEVAEPQPIMARKRVRYVGEIVAAVIAKDRATAQDGAGLVLVAYEDLPPIVEMSQAIEPDRSPIWDACPGNTCFTMRRGDRQATSAAFADAAHTVEVSLVNNRLAPSALETRAYLGDYDTERGQYLLYAAAGKPHTMRDTLAKAVLGVDPQAVRVVAPDIGGGFGSKNVLYPEEALVLWAARRVGRPVRWVADRGEALASDMAGRDQSGKASLALDAGGRILGLKVSMLANLGAYLAPRGAVPPANTLKCVPGPYLVPAAELEIRGVHTNTAPTCSYRGAGAPEGINVIERLLDIAAEATGLDRVELRRRNLVSESALPYETVSGLVYDSGRFEAAMEAALAGADWSGFEARRRDSAARGRLRGIGLANMIEASGFGYSETATLRVHHDGGIDILIGTMSSGQGHATVYAQIAADALGLPLERFRMRQGDTAEVPTGSGTGASRSLTVGGSAVLLCAARLRDEAVEAFARIHAIEPGALAYEDGHVHRRGWSLGALESLAEPDRPFEASATFSPGDYTFPNGCHVAEVEIDPETGRTALLRYTAVQDVGRAVNPLVIKGQLHGGITQGIGQAMIERVVYDESGQLLTGSFMDYGLPRAADVPPMHIELLEVPAPSNPLGAKAVGEAGTIAAPPAIINAILHALRPLGVRSIDMPATPERVWHAIRRAEAGAAPAP